MKTLQELGYKVLQVFYKDNVKIIVNDEGIEKTVEGKQSYLTWDELQALNSLKPTENNLIQPETTEKAAEPNVVKIEKKRGPKKRLYTVVNKWTDETVCRGVSSQEAYKIMGLSTINKFRLILNEQKNGKHHAKWEIKEQTL